MRWRLRLEEYDYEIQYKKGKGNQVADTLSRLHPLKVTSNERFPNKIRVRDLETEFNDWKTIINTGEIPVRLVTNHRTWTQLDYEILRPFNVRQWLQNLNTLANDKDKIISEHIS